MWKAYTSYIVASTAYKTIQGSLSGLGNLHMYKLYDYMYMYMCTLSYNLIALDYIRALLQEGRGCCFVVDPPSSPLLPFTTHTLTITAYSDMWGDYHDTLICQVRIIIYLCRLVSYTRVYTLCRCLG